MTVSHATRRERALSAVFRRRDKISAGPPSTFKLGADAAVNQYEAELAADLAQVKGKLLHARAMLYRDTPVNSRILIALEDLDAAVDLLEGSDVA